MSYQPRIKPQPANLRPKRIIPIGDPHFGVGANDDFFFRSMVSYFRDIIIPWLEEVVKDGDIIVWMGDIFDNDTALRTEVQDAVLSIFERIARICPSVVIVGNHDVVKKRSNEVNSLRSIGNIDNVYVYYKPEIWETAYGKGIFFYPWLKDIESLDQFQIAANEGCEVLVSHAHFNGLAFDNEFVKKAEGEIKSIDAKDLKMFKLVVNGHIHAKQNVLNILNVGAPYQLTYNDEKNKPGIHIIDLVDYKNTFIENKFSPRFYRSDIAEFLEMTKNDANACIANKLVRINYPAELAKVFTLDSVRRELHGFVDVEFEPEYNYKDVHMSASDAAVPEVVDLKKILAKVAGTMDKPKVYIDSLIEELDESYKKHTHNESLDL